MCQPPLQLPEPVGGLRPFVPSGGPGHADGVHMIKYRFLKPFSQNDPLLYTGCALFSHSGKRGVFVSIAKIHGKSYQKAFAKGIFPKRWDPSIIRKPGKQAFTINGLRMQIQGVGKPIEGPAPQNGGTFASMSLFRRRAVRFCQAFSSSNSFLKSRSLKISRSLDERLQLKV